MSSSCGCRSLGRAASSEPIIFIISIIIRPENTSILMPYLDLGSRELQNEHILPSLSLSQKADSLCRYSLSASDISRASSPFSFHKAKIHKSLKRAKSDSQNLSGDIPLESIICRAQTASSGLSLRFVIHFSSSLLLLPPVKSRTLSSVRLPLPRATACSVRERASRSAPSAWRAISHTASFSLLMFSHPHTYEMRETMSAIDIL